MLGHPQETDDLPEELGADGCDGRARRGYVVLVCLLAPIAEELFFRGLRLHGVARGRSACPSARSLTGAIFGAIHAGGTGREFIVPLAVFGAACACSTLDGSLLPCIVLHALNNGLALGVAEDWGGVDAV